MSTQNIVVIGASAGGISPMKELVKGLPSNYKGTIFIVLHIPAASETELPRILSNAGPLKAVLAKDDEPFKPGMIYVAPSDHHLLLHNGRMVVRRGPKENCFRPSIDVLFRSAAHEYRSRVVGIILSGVLNDGTSGAWAIERLGGTVILQDPSEAQQPQMVENVLEYVKPHYTLPASTMGAKLVDLAKKKAVSKDVSARLLERLKTEVIIAKQDNAFEMGIMEMGELTPFTCPDCHGTLVRLKEGELIRFRCHTGHAYTSSSLLADVTGSVESMLWQSMRGMEEMSMLLKQIGEHFKERGNVATSALFREQASDAARRAQIIHDSLFEMRRLSEDMRFKAERKSRRASKR
jgi:two-component system chemotaxis response regulator CheB